MMTINDLLVGQMGRILSLNSTDGPGLRMLEMGLTPGAIVRLLGRAPFGDPLEIEIRGYRLSLRSNEAALANVLPLGPEAPLSDSGGSAG
jgi:ferrous iron transport protein A